MKALASILALNPPRTFRRFRQQRMATVMLNCLTVITSSVDRIPEDLQRRVKVIRLVAGKMAPSSVNPA